MIDRLQFLQEIKSRDSKLGLFLEKVLEGIDGLATHLSVSPFGKTQPPDPIKSISVKAGTDHVHVTLNDPSQVRKNIQYFIEYANNPSFAGAHVEHLGASRGRVLPLPAKDDNGNPVTYYFRGFPQHLGSDPQPIKTTFGGRNTPTGVTLTGSSKLTLLPSPGSGTAPPDGSRPGAGLGNDLRRLPQGPKVPAPPRPR